MPAHHARFYLPIMSETPAPTGMWREPGRYEIRIVGHLDARWAAWFDGWRLRRESDGTTVIDGPLGDQAALHGVLQRVRDLGMTLISVTQVDRPDVPTTQPR